MAAPSAGTSLESALPMVTYNGLNTNKAVNFSGTQVDTSGNISGTGNLSVAGTSLFTGVATFTAAPVFNGGRVPNIISGSGATVTLTAGQSGSLVLMDRAAGIVFTLPAPVVGLEFTFVVSVTITSNSYKVITNTGTVLLAGSILGSVDNTANKSWVGDGATHIAVTQAAASTNATGGIVGSQVTFRCTTTLQWNVTGMTVAGGTPSTPFATS